RRLLRAAGAESLSFELLNSNVDQPYKYVATWLIDEWSKIGLRVTQRRPLAERLTIQAEVGRAEALYQSGRAFLYDSGGDSGGAVQAGREIEVRKLAMLRLARTHAVQAAVQAIDLMYTAAGGSSVYASNLLERAFRDVHTVTQHLSMNPANY